MPEDTNPSHCIAKLILGELEHFKTSFRPNGGAMTFHGQAQLMHEPFVGYARVSNKVGDETKLLICRHYVPFHFHARGQHVEFASYLSPLGRIIAKKPGQEHKYQIKTRSGFVLEDHCFYLHEKDEFTPRLQEGVWDAFNNQISWINGRLLALSLKKLLQGGSEELEIRQVRYSVQLPDQAILDQSQDEIFRLPLQARVRISGAPGTGKTTVLLKRLSQKTKREFLEEAESNSIRDEDWQEGRNWILFTPSDLLKVYLKEAMAKELLPASDDHVKVYRTFRLELLRDIGFIRVGQHGYFKVAPEDLQLLKRNSGGDQIAFAKAFGENLAERYSEAFRAVLQTFNNETRTPLAKLSDVAQKVLNVALDILSKPIEDMAAMQKAQHRAAGYRKLNEDLNKLVNVVRGVAALYDANNILPLARIYRQTQILPSILTSLTTAGIDVALFPEIPPIVESLRRDVKDLNEAITLSRLFQLLPRCYQEFRETPENQKRFYVEQAEKAIKERLISEFEQNVLLFHSLEFVRELTDDIPKNLNGVPNEIRTLLARMRLLVCVDEVADFSPLEVACIERLAKRGGGITMCGDLMQRVTEQGLKEWSDLADFSEKYEGRDLKISYRQTERLFAIAKDLFRHSRGIEPDFSSAFPKRREDPPPLQHKGTQEHPVEHWLTNRICEIHALCGQHLPTTALLVARPEDVEPLKQKLGPILRENGLEIEASNTGQALGDSARVRIFPVEFIKGLEFEAVFYVSLDRMAEIHKELIDKYVYVGLSRARSFLGVTIERQFPQRLNCIAEHLVSKGTWAINSNT